MDDREDEGGLFRLRLRLRLRLHLCLRLRLSVSVPVSVILSVIVSVFVSLEKARSLRYIIFAGLHRNGKDKP